MFLDTNYIREDHIAALETASELSTGYNHIVMDYDGVIGEASSKHKEPSKKAISKKAKDLVDEINKKSNLFIFSNRKNNGGTMNGLEDILEIQKSQLKDSKGNKSLKSSWSQINDCLYREVLVVEDSFSGIVGARRNGYDTIYIQKRNGSYTGFLGLAKDFEDFLARKFLSD